MQQLSMGLSAELSVTPSMRYDGESAVLWIGAHECDLCIITYELPGMDGLETYARIRTRKPDLPVIILGETTDQHVAIAAFREGAIDFVAVQGNFVSVVCERIKRTFGEYIETTVTSPTALEDPTLGHIPRELLAPTFQNRLRSIGRQLDIYGYHTVTILDIEGGFLVRANRQRARKPQALEFPDRDFPRLVASAMEDDASKPEKPFHQSDLIPTGYEDVLRALGYRLDEVSASSIMITELEEQLVVSFKGNDERAALPGLITVNWMLSPSDIEFILNEAFYRRGQQPKPTISPAPEQGGIRGILRRLN
jgi:CheY-like chemotaxis protein